MRPLSASTSPGRRRGRANGDTIAADGAAGYQGLDYFLDDDPVRRLHLFVNGNVEAARYTTYVVGGVSIIPVGAFQFAGTQTIFNNNIAAPSNLTMSSYGTLNGGLAAPFKHIDIIFNALNILNKKYNEYLYVSSGGYLWHA